MLILSLYLISQDLHLTLPDTAPVSGASIQSEDAGEQYDYDSITVAEIKEKLDEKDIDYSSTAKKSELFKLLTGGEGNE